MKDIRFFVGDQDELGRVPRKLGEPQTETDARNAKTRPPGVSERDQGISEGGPRPPSKKLLRVFCQEAGGNAHLHIAPHLEGRLMIGTEGVG